MYFSCYRLCLIKSYLLCLSFWHFNSNVANVLILVIKSRMGVIVSGILVININLFVQSVARQPSVHKSDDLSINEARQHHQLHNLMLINGVFILSFYSDRSNTFCEYIYCITELLFYLCTLLSCILLMNGSIK